MSKLTPVAVQDLITKAFVLEAVADKTDCTSRFTDLEGKPLEDFVIAGINAGEYFRKFAKDRQNGSTEIYRYLVPAIKNANQHKSAKYINMGLLEIMFNAVAARLACDDPATVVKQINKGLRQAPKSDVQSLIGSRKIAWSTSVDSSKSSIFQIKELMAANSPFEFEEGLYEFADKDSAGYQWGEQAHNDWPILEELLKKLKLSNETLLLDKISAAFNPLRAENKEIRVGIMADMCAAAIFLYLSFEKPLGI